MTMNGRGRISWSLGCRPCRTRWGDQHRGRERPVDLRQLKPHSYCSPFNLCWWVSDDAAPPLPPIQVSKTDELAASLAAHQEYHLKQADELQHCHAEMRKFEEASEVRGVHSITIALGACVLLGGGREPLHPHDCMPCCDCHSFPVGPAAVPPQLPRTSLGLAFIP